MTTHLRARAAQAGVLLALVVGGIAAAPAAALATPPNVQVISVSPTSVLAGGQVKLQYSVGLPNNGGGGGGGGDNLTHISVTGMSCSGDCTPAQQIDGGNNQQFNATLTAPQVAAGANQTVTVTITATNGNDQNSKQLQITVQGPDKPQTVTGINGTVKDQDGKSVAGAAVAAQDSSGNTFQATTNGSGAFAILASDSKPITPGSIRVAAGKDDVTTTVTVTGEAGKTVKVQLTLKLDAASPSASASASTSVAASAPADAGLDTTVPSQVAINPNAGENTNNASQNSSSGSMLFIILGGLLVAAGVGAIVLVLMRRRNSGGRGGDGPDDPTALGGGPGVVPPSQGRFNDATRIASPVGAGPAAATMVAPRSGAPSMADAPTMLQRPVPAADDEFPDPYGAPLPQSGGYAGAAAGGWDDHGQQYGAQDQYGQPADDYAAGQQYGGGQGEYGGGQYGAAPAAPAGGQERYDEHTSLYRPESEQDSYGNYQQGGYGAAAEPAGPQYGGGGQYGAGANAGGQYGGGYGGGHPDEDYRSGSGYQSAGGYSQEPAEQGGYGSWGTPAGGIDSGSGYAPQPGAQGGAAPANGAPGSGQYGGGTYGGAANPGGSYGGGAPAQGGTYGGGAPAGQYGGGAAGGQQYGGGYDDRGGYDQGQGYEQPAGGNGAGGEYGAANAPANGQVPQQGGGYGAGYENYDEPENNAGYNGGRRAAGPYDEQQAGRRGGGRRPGDY